MSGLYMTGVECQFEWKCLSKGLPSSYGSVIECTGKVISIHYRSGNSGIPNDLFGLIFVLKEK